MKESLLRSVLRFFGTMSLSALVFVAAPRAWMDAIHASLGLGSLPADPIVGYLARSTSALYALVGGLMWVVSFDPRRHRGVVVYLGSGIAVFGALLVAVDWGEGLPLAWRLWEGPFVAALGLTLFLLGKRIPQADVRQPGT